MDEISKLQNYQLKEMLELISFSPNLVCLTNMQGQLLFVNESWHKILGRSKDSLIGRDLLSFVHINDIGRTKTTLKNSTSSKIEDFENRYYHKDGTVRYIKWTSRPFEKENIVIGIGRDITHEKTFHHQMNNFYHALTDTAIVSITDLRGRIIEVNDTFCQISGYSREELLGKDHRILNSKLHSPSFFKELWDTVLAKKTWRGQVCNMKKDGSLYWVDSFVMALTNLNGDIEKLISIRYDITDKKESEHQMIQSARLASLGEMSASIAHEINNPLSVIKFVNEELSQMIADDKVEKNELIESNHQINKAIARIMTVIKGLQAYARQSDNDGMEIQGLDKILDETLVFSQYKFKDSNVEFRLGEMVDANINARPSQISQILVNLINNAIDAIADQPSSWVKLSSSIKGDHLHINVTDSGKGIPKDIVSKLMHPFFTTKSAGKGTGLGLSLSHKLAKQHGGDLFYDENYPNTRFTLILPLATKP